MSAFEEFGIFPELGKAVSDMDWLLPTDIQAEAVPLILGGGDVLMAAETGSGKTGAFCLPVLQIVAETLSGTSSAKRAKKESRAIMSITDRDVNFAIAADGLTCQSRVAEWQGGRSTTGVRSGKAYFEATVSDEGLCRIGVAALTASLGSGLDDKSFGYGGTGKKAHAKKFQDYGETFGLGDVIGCCIDRKNQTISFTKNGKDLGHAADIPSHLHQTALFPCCTLKNAELKFNFGQTALSALPDGFTALASLPPGSSVDASESTTAGAEQSNGPFAIILEPSRELAEQTFNQIELFKKYLNVPIRSSLLIGGVNPKEQLRVLKKGVEIVVGTPGRVKDFIETCKLDVKRVNFFILDEVDGLLSQGHKDMIHTLYRGLPKEASDGRRLQMIVCSATLHSPDVKKLAKDLMFHPAWVDLKGQDSVPETVHHVVCRINPQKDNWWHKPPAHVTTDGMHNQDKLNFGSPSREALSEGVKRLKYKYLLAAIDVMKMDQAIIFCRTKYDCDNVENFLLLQGGGSGNVVNEYSCACMHSGRRTDDRRRNLQKFKEGEVRFLICTDVAARGIDVQGIPFVINFTLPDDKANYIHRIGRVGRADRMGLAISLVSTVQEKVWFVSNGPFKGPGHHSTKLVSDGGCAIWYDEPGMLSSIQEHLGEVIASVDEDMSIPANEIDGKAQVVYGERRKRAQPVIGHAALLAPSVTELTDLEAAAQTSFLSLRFKGISG